MGNGDGHEDLLGSQSMIMALSWASSKREPTPLLGLGGRDTAFDAGEVGDRAGRRADFIEQVEAVLP
jgi:hypothetical protein